MNSKIETHGASGIREARLETDTGRRSRSALHDEHEAVARDFTQLAASTAERRTRRYDMHVVRHARHATSERDYAEAVPMTTMTSESCSRIATSRRATATPALRSVAPSNAAHEPPHSRAHGAPASDGESGAEDCAAAGAQTQGPKRLPSSVHTCAPMHPAGVAQAWLTPGTQRGGPSGAAAALAEAFGFGPTSGFA